LFPEAIIVYSLHGIVAVFGDYSSR